MKKKFAGIVLIVFAFALGTLMFEAYARDGGKAKGGHQGLEQKISKKAHLILKNKEELSLSDAQVDKIKDLKVTTKKDLIRKKAELNILVLDIKTELYKEKINTSAVNKLIDKKYNLKKDKAKYLVNVYAALKNVLTEEQKKEMKGLWKKCKKGKMHGSMMKDKMGHQMMKDKMKCHMMGK